VSDTREATVRSAAAMSAGTFASRATGLIRVCVTLAALGVSATSDAYNAANTTPNIVYELILGGILTSVFVPVLVHQAKTHGAQARDEAASRLLTLTVVVLVGVAAVGALTAPWIMRAYLSGVEDPVQREQEIELGTFFLRWFMPQMVFYGIAAVAGGVLTTHRRFAAQMFTPVLNNLTVIVTMIVFIQIHDGSARIAELTTGERTLLAVGTTLGVVAMAVGLLPALRRIGFRWRPRFDWRHESVARLLRLGRWVLVYVAANQLAFFVIIRFSVTADPAGGITAYSQAFIFFSLPHAIVAVSIFTALLPGLAERWAADDRDGVRELFSRGLRDTVVAMLPAAVGYAVLAGPIVALLAQYGAVGSADAQLLARTLAAFAVGLPFFSVFQLLTRTYYAGHDSKTPALVNIGAAAVNLAADVVLAFVFDLGVPGLALGHATSYAVGSIVLFWLLRKRLHGADERRIASTVGRSLLATACMGAVVLAVAAGIDALLDVDRAGGRLVQVAAAVAAGVLVFGLTAVIFRVREVDEVRSALLARFRP